MHGADARKEKKPTSSLLCLLKLQINPHLRSATIALPSLPSVTTNLQTIYKTFISKHPSIYKSKFATHTRYTVIIRIF